MSMTAAPTYPVLADLLPKSRAKEVALLLAGTLLLTIAGQIAVPLWFTPVPLSLATFAVVLEGAALGPWRAVGSVGLYLVLGMAGAPLFADQHSGWAFASFGYIVGYVPAAMVVGILSRRRADRSVLSTVAMTALGSVIVYAFGLPWLMSYAHVGLDQGMRLGVYPFLVGDLVKSCIAAVLLPATWRAVQHFTRQS